MWGAVEPVGVVVVVDVGGSAVTDTYCEVYGTCGPYPSENLDYVWSSVGLGLVVAVLIVVVWLTRRW